MNVRNHSKLEAEENNARQKGMNELFWKRQKLDYDILIPPLEKPIQFLSKSEAQKYFAWYISNLDERIRYLEAFSKVRLDYTPESLIPLWNWFLKNAKIEKTPKARVNELEAQLAVHGRAFTKTVIANNGCQLSLKTEYIILDIAMYFGQVFVKNHPEVYWEFYTTPKDAFTNHPVLMGFPNEIFPNKKGVPLPPHHIVRVQATKILRNSASKHDLLSIYEVWAEKLSD